MEKGSEAPDCGDYLLAGEGYSSSFYELQTRHTVISEALQGDLTIVESSRWWAVRGNSSFAFLAVVLGHDLLRQLRSVLFQCHLEALRRFMRQNMHVDDRQSTRK